jgi:hypothetical protein
VIHGLERRPVFLRFRIERLGPVAFASPQFVEDQVAGDLEEPGGEFGGRLVARGGFPNADENLLREILRLELAAEHLGDGADDPVLMRLDQEPERFGVTLFYGVHPHQILRRAVGRGISGLEAQVFGHVLGRNTLGIRLVADDDYNSRGSNGIWPHRSRALVRASL